jgi:hypothetical protein
MKTTRRLSFALIVLVIVCSPVLAHHGNAAYADKMIELKQATVTKFLWSNPHSLIYFDAKDDKGNLVHWVTETGSPSALILIGWEKTSVQTGDVVTIYAYPSKSGSPASRLNRIVLPDGTTLHDTQLGGEGDKARYNPAADSKGEKKPNP